VEDAALACRTTRARRDRNGRRRAHNRRDTARESLPVDRIAVVTGASRGIGEAIARALAAQGWQLVLLARNEDRLRALAAELGAEYELCDVGKREDVERVAAAVLERHPQIQLLVNNAGMPGRSGFAAIDLELLEEVLRVNYLGGVWMLRALLPGLEAAGRSDVVNIVSVAGTVAFAPAGPYSASKHAQLAFSRATAAELRSRGIHVHTVNPGFVETPGFPQRTRFGRAGRTFVVEPPLAVERLLAAVDHGRTEIVVPRWYRPAAWLQALAPGAVARAQGAYRRRSST
jgi:uncharacterized protein